MTWAASRGAIFDSQLLSTNSEAAPYAPSIGAHMAGAHMDGGGGIAAPSVDSSGQIPSSQMATSAGMKTAALIVPRPLAMS
jgi:hypothetical protein